MHNTTGRWILTAGLLFSWTATCWAQTDPCLVAWWKFDEGSGTSAADSAGGHHGVLTGDPCWVPGIDNTALDLDGDEDRVTATHHEDMNLGTGAFTLSAWILNRNTPGSPWKRIITKSDSGGTWYSLCLNGANLAVELAENFFTNHAFLAAPPVIQGDGLWHHVAAVRDHLSNVYLYVDGVEHSVGTATPNVSNAGPLVIGGFEAHGEGSYMGRVDDVRIYVRALSPAEIRHLAEPLYRASAPDPGDQATAVSWEPALSWTAGTDALSYDIYLDTVNPPLALAADDHLSTTLDVGPLAGVTTYYWRVDENTPTGTIAGDVWQFTTAPWVGSGAETDPYQIADKADLLTLAAQTGFYDRHFILTADIDLAGETFTTAVIAPQTNAASSSFEGTAFTGAFDGNGHAIRNLTIVASEAWTAYLGLFGCLNAPASVVDVGLENVNIIGEGSFTYVAGLAALVLGGTVSQCYVSGAVTQSNSCEHVGGLVGYNEDGTISLCHSRVGAFGGHVTISLGNLVGCNEGTIIQCYASGSVAGGQSGSLMAGLVGSNWGMISQCYATGAVSGHYELGGLVGWNHGTISQCFAVGAVDGQLTLGGLVGQNYGDISRCYAVGAVTGGYPVGGLAGRDNGMISDSFWDTDTTDQGTSDGGGTGMTTFYMQQAGTYVDSGWDFASVWSILEQQSYPYFRWSGMPGACGDLANPYPPGDSNLDCVVDLLDLAVLASNWLTDARP